MREQQPERERVAAEADEDEPRQADHESDR